MDDNQNLSVLDENSTLDLKSVTPKMKEFIINSNEVILSEIQDKLRQRPGLVGVLFPGKLQREYDKLSVQKMKDSYAIQKLMMDAYTNSLIEQAKKESDMAIALRVEQYENVLKAVKINNRKQLTAIAQTCINEMSATFEQSRIAFGERRERQIKDVERYKKDEFYYKKLKQNLNKEAEIFLDTIGDLLQGFKDALINKFDIVVK
jgi:hypothetical protein